LTKPYLYQGEKEKRRKGEKEKRRKGEKEKRRKGEKESFLLFFHN
jgi:hypothetical protein